MPKILKVRHYKAGYDVHTEEWASDELGCKPGGNPIVMKSAYSPDGAYIGTSKFAYRLCKIRGVKPETIDSSWSVCSIGFIENEKRWAGWSHRAFATFGIGDKLFDPKWRPNGATWEEMETMPFIERGEVTIETLDQARQAAINFADYVS